ncbi:hypothetical protein OG226_34370 [Streptomyces sp. NBC_01261]|uniref:hypothetical protein n=1 Tax=unclassified Streptomyces TaxID=2593676 RepID=UPI002E287785|nr:MULTISPECIES: hypothetical protein [unclassified Streptomyces]
MARWPPCPVRSGCPSLRSAAWRSAALPFFVQFTTQRSAERAQQRWQRTELAESRRAERLAPLERFVEVDSRPRTS